jgi:multiple sugar transport system substrate-binding protein
MWDGAEQFDTFADAYEEIYPNVDITTVTHPWEDYWTKLPLALRNGDGPALFNVHNSYHDNLVGYMDPYDVDVDALVTDYIGAGAHVIDGDVHYVDYGLMTGLIYYNTEMWQAAGLTQADIPTTWEELEAVAQQLTIRDGDSFTQAGFNYNGLFKELTLGLPYQEGGRLTAADRTTPALDNDATAAVIDRFLSFYTGAKVGSPDFGPVAADSFGQGQTAMVYNWGHFGATLDQNFPGIEWSTFPTPVDDADAFALDRYNGESTWGVNAGADEAERAVAQDFLAFSLTSADLMKDLALHYSVYPMYAPLAGDPDLADDKVLSALGDVSRYIWPGPLPASFETSVTSMWEDILYNGVDPDDALAAANAAIAQDLDGGTFVSVEHLYAPAVG